MTGPKRILVVDDEPTARVLMRAALQKAGFDVQVASSGEQALAMFRATPFDMVMLDVEMPGMDGHETCAALRARIGDEFPVVMVTGMDDTPSIERAYESGATDFFAKPINWALIGHRVRYLFRAYQTQLALRAAKARSEAILSAIPDTMFRIDLNGAVLDARHVGTASFAQHVPRVGATLADLFEPDRAAQLLAAARRAREQGAVQTLDLSLRHDTAGARDYEVRVAASDADEALYLVRDITERKEAERSIFRLAYFDSLTGLPNRQAFLERLEREVRRSHRDGKRLAVLFLDLDGFKDVNDTMGHNAGDLILQWAADRLQQAIRPSDLLARPTGEDAENEAGERGGKETEVELARLGGDEFTALILNIRRPEDALVVAHRIREVMQRPFRLEKREILLTASIGIALYPGDGEDAGTLLKHADTAMYHAKDSGRDNCQLYSASLTERAMRRMHLDSSLRLALERDQLAIEYQPQLDAVDGRIRSVEALLRWQHPELGTIMPEDFVPLAEENGLIVAIGRWVLMTACTDAARWQRDGHPVRVAVNLSPHQFKDPALLRNVQSALEYTGLAPELLELEVTEGALMEDTAATMATLRALRDSGVSLALDDFGTGYSSMSYLKRMPVNNLKVDRSFVSSLPGDGDNFAIVKAIISLAKSLGFSVTAEGVETREQARVLRGMSCDTLQGFYFSAPVAAQEVGALLARAPGAHAGTVQPEAPDADATPSGGSDATPIEGSDAILDDGSDTR